MKMFECSNRGMNIGINFDCNKGYFLFYILLINVLVSPITSRVFSHDTQQNVNRSVSSTARDIQRLGVVVRRGDKPQKLQVERLTQAFRDALANYSAVQKVGYSGFLGFTTIYPFHFFTTTFHGSFKQCLFNVVM